MHGTSYLTLCALVPWMTGAALAQNTLDLSGTTTDAPQAELPAFGSTAAQCEGTTTGVEPYQSHVFYVDTDGSYAFDVIEPIDPGGMDPVDDTVLLLYQGGFDPANACDHFVAVGNETPQSGLAATLTAALDPSDNYVLVVAGFLGSEDAYTVRITGPAGSIVGLDPPPAMVTGTVVFQVNMSRELRLGNVNFLAGEIVGVRGSQAPLDWGQTLQMLDADGDSVYTAEALFTLPENTEVEYKFVHNVPGQDPGAGWESDVGPGGSFGNRVFTFTGDATLPVVFFNNVTGVSTEDEAVGPARFALEGSYPNPFQARTEIGYVLAQPAAVEVAVYDAMGRRVQKLVSSEQAAGRHEVIFEAEALPSGVYFYRLTAGSFTAVGQMLLLR